MGVESVCMGSLGGVCVPRGVPLGLGGFSLGVLARGPCCVDILKLAKLCLKGVRPALKTPQIVRPGLTDPHHGVWGLGELPRCLRAPQRCEVPLG